MLLEKDRTNKSIIFFLLVMTCLKIWLVLGQSMTVYGNFVHDDRLFVNLANFILNGQWLGEYNNLTLAKGPFYSIWMAMSFISGLQLLISEHIFYIFSVLLLILALRPVLSRWSTAFLYIILLFNPISFADGPMTRVMREGIYPALT